MGKAMADSLSLDLKKASLEDESSESEGLPMKSPVAPLVLGNAKQKSYDEESDIHDDLIVTLVFPQEFGGKEKELHCKSVETVINMKKKLFDEFEIPFSCKISFEDKLMLDPLSLNDFPDLISACAEKKKPRLVVKV